MFTSHSAYRSIHIVALGSECPGGVGQGEEILGQGQLQGGLLWSYLGHGALVGHCDLEDSLHNPAFMEYTSRVFGDVTVVVRDCPSWVRDSLSAWGALGWGNNGLHTAVKHFTFEALSSRLQPFFLSFFLKAPVLNTCGIKEMRESLFSAECGWEMKAGFLLQSCLPPSGVELQF